MNFEHFKFLIENTFKQGTDVEGALPAKYKDIPVERLHPLVLAYIGDAYFTLFIRTRLLSYEQNKVRILHTFDAKIVSAAMQAVGYKGIEEILSEEEIAVVRRGRNAKSNVPKSATISEYRYSTGFESLLGYLYLSEKFDRLAEIAEKAFVVISREMTNTDKKIKC
ncbi:Mini-ribonuclease 3 [Dendrosporobacter sp. 1207_IL3150]|uniref:Mini-ribonuclease 3 n=1 Tax=Dendrosporobacter sp. 1207_IL3150 TaxID=3084054 RepID=UPI002FDACF50